MTTLIVTNPFGGRGTGAKIADPAEVEAVLAGEHAHSVLRVEDAGADEPRYVDEPETHAQPKEK